MSKDKSKDKDLRRRTQGVDNVQIIGQRPVTAEMQPSGEVLTPRRRKPPVRELARTGLFQPVLQGPVPQLPPDDAPAESDATRVQRDLVEPASAAIVRQCPIALFQLDGDGRVEWANEAFADFSRKPAEELAGERIDATRLGVIYPTIYDDIQTCLGEEQPPTLRQTLRYQLQDGREQVRGCWVVPEMAPDGRVTRLFGYLLPFED